MSSQGKSKHPRGKRRPRNQRNRRQKNEDSDDVAPSSSYMRSVPPSRRRDEEKQYRGRPWSKGSQRQNKVSQEKCGEDEDNEINIPGFYYDKEKKKYFKILPNHNSGASGSITQEVLTTRAVEKKRQHDLVEFFKPRTCSYELSGNKPSCLRSSNCHHLITGCRLGLRSPSLSQGLFRKYFIQTLRPRAKVDVVQQIPEDFAFDLDNLEDAKKMLISPDATCLVGVWSLKQFIRERLQMIQIEPIKYSSGSDNVCVRTKACDHIHAFEVQKVTSLCWAPRPGETEHTSQVLFTTTSFIGDPNNMARLIDLNIESGNPASNYFDIGPKMTWSNAWCGRTNQFSIGTESCTLLMDVVSRRLWEFYSGHSAVHTLAMSQGGHSLYSGTRSGMIYTHDLRSKSTRPVSVMSHKQGIAHIYLSSQESTIIASDVTGQIKKWDLRQKKVLHDYPGHINQYVKQPFHVDRQENFLFAVGQDCYTRIWCYRSGSLLHSLPPPNPISIDSIPLIAYSDNMGGQGGLPGLLMASKAQFHFYSC